jgi:hypothetical protein
MGPLLFHPEFGIFTVPSENTTGSLRSGPRMKTPYGLELYYLIGLGKSFFNVTQFLYVE